MKNFFALLGLMGLVQAAAAGTAVTARMRDLTGSDLNRTVTFTQLDGPLGVYGTNLVYGGPLTVQPVDGTVTTNLYMGNYRLTFKGLPKAVQVFIPDTTNTVNLADPAIQRQGIVQVFTLTQGGVAAGTNITAQTNDAGVVTINAEAGDALSNNVFTTSSPTVASNASAAIAQGTLPFLLITTNTMAGFGPHTVGTTNAGFSEALASLKFASNMISVGGGRVDMGPGDYVWNSPGIIPSNGFPFYLELVLSPATRIIYNGKTNYPALMTASTLTGVSNRLHLNMHGGGIYYISNATQNIIKLYDLAYLDFHDMVVTPYSSTTNGAGLATLNMEDDQPATPSGLNGLYIAVNSTVWAEVYSCNFHALANAIVFGAARGSIHDNWFSCIGWDKTSSTFTNLWVGNGSDLSEPLWFSLGSGVVLTGEGETWINNNEIFNSASLCFIPTDSLGQFPATGIPHAWGNRYYGTSTRFAVTENFEGLGRYVESVEIGSTAVDLVATNNAAMTKYKLSATPTVAARALVSSGGTLFYNGPMDLSNSITASGATFRGLNASQFVATDGGKNLASTLNGSTLTSLNADNIASGTLSASRLPALGAAYPNALTNNESRIAVFANYVKPHGLVFDNGGSGGQITQDASGLTIQSASGNILLGGVASAVDISSTFLVRGASVMTSIQASNGVGVGLPPTGNGNVDATNLITVNKGFIQTNTAGTNVFIGQVMIGTNNTGDNTNILQVATSNNRKTFNIETNGTVWVNGPMTNTATFRGSTIYYGSGGLRAETTGSTITMGNGTQVLDDGLGNVQFGADSTAPAPVRIHGGDATSTDNRASPLSLETGFSTGLGTSTNVAIKTSLEKTVSGSGANSMSTRFLAAGSPVTLTAGSATVIGNIAFAGTSNYLGAELTVTVNAIDATSDYQSITTKMLVDAVSKAGTVTPAIAMIKTNTAVSSGTITAEFTVAANANSVDIQCNAASSLTETNLTAKYVITALNSDDAVTVTTK